ncbi:MAG: hypothetical protein ABGF52_13525 [Candidatus Asgardarchaeum sp.]
MKQIIKRIDEAIEIFEQKEAQIEDGFLLFYDKNALASLKFAKWAIEQNTGLIPCQILKAKLKEFMGIK